MRTAEAEAQTIQRHADAAERAAIMRPEPRASSALLKKDGSAAVEIAPPAAAPWRAWFGAPRPYSGASDLAIVLVVVLSLALWSIGVFGV